MFKLSIFYPNVEGQKFDMEYYCKNHMPLVKELLGSVIKGWAAEEGIASAEPGKPAPYVGIGHLYFDSVEEFGMAMAPHSARINGDIQNFATVPPLTQISVVVGEMK